MGSRFAEYGTGRDPGRDGGGWDVYFTGLR